MIVYTCCHFVSQNIQYLQRLQGVMLALYTVHLARALKLDIHHLFLHHELLVQDNFTNFKIELGY